MKKFIVLLFTFIWVLNLFSQIISYNAIIIDGCDSVTVLNGDKAIGEISSSPIQNGPGLEFNGINSMEGIYNLSNDLVILPDTGFYVFWSHSKSIREEVQIKHVGLNVDTFYTKRLIYKAKNKGRRLSKYLYCDCNEPVNGRYTNFYKNGNLKQQGRFKGGLILDTLKEFRNNDGSVFKAHVIKNKENVIIYYNKDGFISSMSVRERRFFGVFTKSLLFKKGSLFSEKRFISVLNKRIRFKGTFYKDSVSLIMNFTNKFKYYYNDEIVRKSKRRKVFGSKRMTEENGAKIENWIYDYTFYAKNGDKLYEIQVRKKDDVFMINDSFSFNNDAFYQLEVYNDNLLVEKYIPINESVYQKYVRKGFSWNEENIIYRSQFNNLWKELYQNSFYLRIRDY